MFYAKQKPLGSLIGGHLLFDEASDIMVVSGLFFHNWSGEWAVA